MIPETPETPEIPSVLYRDAPLADALRETSAMCHGCRHWARAGAPEAHEADGTRDTPRRISCPWEIECLSLVHGDPLGDSTALWRIWRVA